RPRRRSRGWRRNCARNCAGVRKPGPERFPCASASRSWAASCPPSRCSPWFRPSSPASRAERPSFPEPLHAPACARRPWEVEVLQLLSNALLSLLRRVDRSESGQSTAEYAMVMIAAAAVAGLVLAWAKHTNLIGGLFDTVVHSLLHL